MQPYDTTGRKLPLPKARYEAPEPWKDADRKTTEAISPRRDLLDTASMLFAITGTPLMM